MANGDSAATALIARLTLLTLNLVLLGLGIALCVLGSNEDGTAGLIRAIYAEGGLTMAAFQKPDVALAVSGAFIICTSHSGARARASSLALPYPARHPPTPPDSAGRNPARNFNSALTIAPPVSRTPRAASDLAPARSAPSSRTTPCVSFSSPVSYSARR